MAGLRPFRFGLSATAFASPGGLRELARKVEDGGWSTLVVPDHLGAPSSFAVLLAAAEVTERLRLGTLVLNSDFFHPLRLAQEAATVDLLTDGRLELGLGSGWNRFEYELLGVAYDRPQDRAVRLGESVRTMKKAWAGEITLGGRPEPVAAVLSPQQRPHPPLLIGGHGDASLSVAAAEADIVGLTGLTWTGSRLEPTGAAVDILRERVAFVRARAGERAESLEFNLLVQIVSVGAPLEAQIDDLAAEHSVPADLLRTSPLALVGSRTEVTEKLLAIRQQTAISYFSFFQSAFDDLAPVVATLAGT